MRGLILCLRIFISCAIQSFFLLSVGVIQNLNGKMASDVFRKVGGVQEWHKQVAGIIVFISRFPHFSF